MTKRQEMQDLIDSLVRDEIKEDYYLEYRPNQGWYLVPHQPRFYYESGDFLGRNYNDAIQHIKSRQFYSIYS